MLKATQFLTITSNRADNEEVRLRHLYSEISKLPECEKQRLVSEFLEIVEGSNERMWPRIQACSILGGQRMQLGIGGSIAVVKRLRNVLEKDFVLRRRTGLFDMSCKATLLSLTLMRFYFLESLILTLLRIDFVNMTDYAQEICSLVVDVQLRTELLDAVKKEMCRLSLITEGKQ
jgi:hypothetical protein